MLLTTSVLIYLFVLLRLSSNQHHITYNVIISLLNTTQAATTIERVFHVKQVRYSYSNKHRKSPKTTISKRNAE
jgi:hypothetical protein